MSSVYNTNNITAGSIYRIFLENFVTYSEVEFYPGTSLNIIIGPNGTGKSTFVSAIILGLCGKANLIGRMNKPSDYIRTGSEKAIIEIELYQKPKQRNVIIKRTIFRDTSKWCIDNKNVDERQVQEYISKFRIQVDNLCQLLPQDRVHDFSKLNPQELLKSTLSAINITSVHQLERLIDNCKEQQRLKTSFTQNENQLNKLQTDNERLRGAYEAMLERKTHKKQINICELKELWLQYCKLLSDITIHENDKKQTERILKPLEKKLKDIEDQVRKHSDNIKRMITERNNFTAKINEAKNTTKHHINSIKSNEDVIRRAELSYKEILARENNREKDIAAERLRLDKLKNDQKNLKKNNAAIEIESQKLDLTLHVKERDIINKEKKRDEIQQRISSKEQEIRQCLGRIQRLEDMNNKRLKILERYSSDTFQAVRWFRENSHLFQEACEPMMLVLQFAEPEYAAHVEATVPRRDLLAFTFTRADDMNRFLRAVRAPPPGPNLRAVGAVCAPPPAPVPRADPLPSHLGFHSYLLDKVQAPDAVLRYLRRLGLARVPLGNEHTYNNFERVPPRITCFFSDRCKYTVHTSRYSREVVRSTQGLAPARLLAAAPDRGALARERDRLTSLQREQEILQENLRVLDAELTTLRSEYDEINERKKSIDININRAKELSALIRNRENNIQSMINQPSAENEKALCDRKKIEAVLNQCKLHKRLCQSFKELQDYIVKRQIVTIKLNKYKEKEHEFNTKLRKSQNGVKEHKEILNKVEKSLKEKTMQANEKKVKLKQKCHDKLPNEKVFPYRKEFAELPNDLEELEERREQLISRMGLINCDAQDIENYENNLQKISELEQELSRNREKEADLKKSSDTLKQQWLTSVETTIKEINKSFSEMFRSVQCEGKVSLHVGETEDDFDKYGIGIWVKFREQSQLMQLTRDTQSGGERALSTALYLLALQRLARVPFRCVDEINQGMDEENERKMLQLLIQATTENSQYFLLSPKLLPNLHYNERVKIHTIMNGRKIIKYKEWDYEKFTKKASLLNNIRT